MAETITHLLREKTNVEVTDVARSAEEALQKLSHLNVDLVLIDVSLPDMNGIDFVATLRQRQNNVACLMLSGHREPGYAKRSLAVGAQGYITKGDPLAIIEGVQTVLAGEDYLSEDLRPHLTDKSA